jgi:acetyl-CoA hydrolase
MIDLRGLIRPGDTVLVAHGSSEPRALVEALIEQRHALGGITVMLGISYTGLFRPEHADAIRFVGLGGAGEAAQLTRAGVLDQLPVHLGAIPMLMATRRLKVDVALVSVAPPRDGRFSLGLAADYARAAIDVARVTVAEINPHMPFTRGDTQLPVDRVAATVDDERPLITVERRDPTPVDAAIAAHVASLIPDGATLQVGIGATPDAVLGLLRSRRALGIHSGLVTDALLDLVESGAVTNEDKEIDRGITLTGSLIGTDRLYRWADGAADLRVMGVGYTHDASVLASLRSLHCINSAIEVDLTGQVNAEMIGGAVIGLVGGHGAFTRAGSSGPGCRSIVAVQSTARNGAVSRIVERLPDGVVTSPRADADVVVTEHGIADLRGLTVSERRRAMISIADPRHREPLDRARPA